jgi:hypothetical protein
MPAFSKVLPPISASAAALRTKILNGLQFLALACFFGLLFTGLSSAQAADWVVTRVSGTVYLVAPGVEAKHVHKGMRLPRGYTIATRKGRAVLQHGRDAITVAPYTEFALSEHGSFSDRTKLLQRKGEISVDVFPRSGPFFTVETPYLAAIVKGTRFTVSVKKGQAQVNVSEGIVGVKDFATGQVADLKAGQAARSAPGVFRGLRSVGKTRANIRPGTPGSPSFGAVNPDRTAAPEPKSGLGGLFGLFGGSGSSTGGNGTSNGSSGVSAGVSAGSGGVTAGASTGGTSAGTSVGGGGISAGASTGGASAGASVGGGGTSAGASAGGASAGASVGGGGASAGASAGGASAGASVGGGGASAGASAGDASAGASVGGGGVSAGASVGGASVGASVGGGGGLLGQ